MWDSIIISSVGIGFDEFEKRHGEQRLFTETNEITADSIVQNALFGHVGQASVDFEDAHTGRDDHRHLPETIKRSIDVLPFEN